VKSFQDRHKRDEQIAHEIRMKDPDAMVAYCYLNIRAKRMEIIFYVTMFFLIICAAALIAETWGEFSNDNVKPI
jgi:hypothetical protein